MSLKDQVRGQGLKDHQGGSGSGLHLQSTFSQVGREGDTSIFSLTNSRPSGSKHGKRGPGLKIPAPRNTEEPPEARSTQDAGHQATDDLVSECPVPFPP